jgi:hypothetical protein
MNEMSAMLRGESGINKAGVTYLPKPPLWFARGPSKKDQHLTLSTVKPKKPSPILRKRFFWCYSSKSELVVNKISNSISDFILFSGITVIFKYFTIKVLISSRRLNEVYRMP